MKVEDLYELVDAVPESKWADVQRYLKVKAITSKAPTDEEIEIIRKAGEKYGNGEYYRNATIDELRAGFKRVNEMIMNREEFNAIFEVNVSEKRWVALKTYLRDLNQPDEMPTADEVELLRLFELEKNSPDFVTYTLEEVMEGYIDDCEELSVIKVMKEDLLQSIDSMSEEHIVLVSKYVEGLYNDSKMNK
ncbi:hypothetical protein [Psychrobacillus sp. BL-248-WT-3]|uniref:hypothetical protein n=1 Tax=Psychrobacillus sp. BL-248-WT-3 TaxID=2725306 RepID=UPI00146A1D09|nr:hypothetical protein [Psychrobacillus sp. BL-248-WT-3]NME06212.1 hypothetical protein [Psychrobacillus sp. BL-248-WT-3]